MRVPTHPVLPKRWGGSGQLRLVDPTKKLWRLLLVAEGARLRALKPHNRRCREPQGRWSDASESIYLYNMVYLELHESDMLQTIECPDPPCIAEALGWIGTQDQRVQAAFFARAAVVYGPDVTRFQAFLDAPQQTKSYGLHRASLIN